MQKAVIFNSLSLLDDYVTSRNFYTMTEVSLKLILKIVKDDYFIVEDGNLHSKAIINNKKFAEFVSCLRSEKVLDGDEIRLVTSSFAKISKDTSSIIKEFDETIELLPSEEIEYTAFSPIHLAISNRLNFFSFLGKPFYQKHKLVIGTNKGEETIYNAYDEHSFNLLRLIEGNQTLRNYFLQEPGFVIHKNTNLDEFGKLNLNEKRLVMDDLFFDSLEMTKTPSNIKPRKIKSIKSIINHGLEYRLSVNKKEYRIYYFAKDGKCNLLLDCIKKNEKITKKMQEIIVKKHSSMI